MKQPKKRISTRIQQNNPIIINNNDHNDHNSSDSSSDSNRIKTNNHINTITTKHPRTAIVQIDLHNLWASVTTPHVSMPNLVTQWIKEYLVDVNTALLSLVNMMIHATGCPHKITSSQFQDHNAVLDYIKELESYMPATTRLYPIISRTKLVKMQITAFYSFFTTLLATDHKCLWDQFFFEVIQSWLATMSSSRMRALRHTATSIALHLVTSLCPQLGTTSHTYYPMVEEVYKTIYESVFMHRYRDVDPLIRRDCMRALADWVGLVPDKFLDPTHLRYFGWYLNDKDASVRRTVLLCIAGLYKNTRVVLGLQMFTERFKGRILEMAVKDVDVAVQSTAVETLCLVYAIGGLDPSQINTLCSVVFSSFDTSMQPKVSDALVGVWQAHTDAMDLAQFVAWLAQLLTLVYPDADGLAETPEDEEASMTLAMETENALVHLVHVMPTLAFFSNPGPWLAQLRCTDLAVPHSHLMLSIISAMAVNSDNVALQMGPQIIPLLKKYQSDNIAESFLYKCLVAVSGTAWCSPPMSNHFETVVHCGQAVFERGADANVLAAVSQLFHHLSLVPGLDVDMRLHIKALLTDGCAPNRPRTYMELLRLIKVPDDLIPQVSEGVALITDTALRLQVQFVMAIHAQVFDAHLVAECVQILTSAAVDEEDTNVLVKTKLTAANILLESYCVMPEPQSQWLSDQVLGALETLVTHQIRNCLIAPKDSDLTTDLQMNIKHTDFPATNSALVSMFAKALALGVIDGAYTATLLQFYNRPPHSSGLDAINLSLELVDVAEAVLFPKVLQERVSESTLVQVCLSSLQRAFQLSEFDMHQEHDSGKEAGVPDLPGAVPKLAQALVSVFKHRKAGGDGASVKKIIDYGAQWLVDRFQPLVPSVPLATNNCNELVPDLALPHHDSDEYAGAVSEYHQNLMAAVVHAGPLLRGLREFVTQVNKPTAIELYRKFCTSPILDLILVALARKAEVKHKPVGVGSLSHSTLRHQATSSVTASRHQAVGSVARKRVSKRGGSERSQAKKTSAVAERTSARQSTRLGPSILSPFEEADMDTTSSPILLDDSLNGETLAVGQDNVHGSILSQTIAKLPLVEVVVPKRSTNCIRGQGQSIALSDGNLQGNGVLDNSSLDDGEVGKVSRRRIVREETSDLNREEFVPSPSPKRRRMM